jgi:hypothetical protein
VSIRSQRELVRASLDMETGKDRHNVYQRRDTVRSIYQAEAERFLLAALAPTVADPR